jgi:aldehyde dehydrogenase
VLAQAAGVNVPAGTQLLFAETDANHPFVQEEQMMPMLPIVRVKSVEEGIAKSLQSEHGYKHTAIIHSHDVENITAMARALDTTLFVKNGPSPAGLGLGRRRLSEFLHRHADGRRHHEPAHVHARPAA